MAAANGKIRCVICNKRKSTLKCRGCSKDFCYTHWDTHRQKLKIKLAEIENNKETFKQSFNQYIQQPNNNNTLIQQINQWEQNSIKKIQQTAEEARQVAVKNTDEYIHQIEIKLNKLTEELRESREEEDFNEINLRQYQEELSRLTKELSKLSNISIREDSKSFINKIALTVSELDFKSNIYYNSRWKQTGITVAGGNGKGNEVNQLDYPISIYIDHDQTIYIADFNNHRIVKWKCGAVNGQVVAGGDEPGGKANQLNNPTDVIFDKERNNMIICDGDNRQVVRWSLQNGTTGKTIISDIDCWRLTIDRKGYIYVVDYKKDEVRRWKIGDINGTLVAGGNGKGNDLNQLNIPTSIFVDEEQSVYVSDYNNNRVMKWIKGAKEGIVVAGGQDKGNSLSQLSGPQGLVVDPLGTIYVADSKNDRIIRWCKRATQGNIVVGGNGPGEQPNQLSKPMDLSFDQEGNLYVVDHWNNRVQRFDIDRN